MPKSRFPRTGSVPTMLKLLDQHCRLSVLFFKKNEKTFRCGLMRHIQRKEFALGRYLKPLERCGQSGSV